MRDFSGRQTADLLPPGLKFRNAFDFTFNITLQPVLQAGQARTQGAIAHFNHFQAEGLIGVQPHSTVDFPELFNFSAQGLHFPGNQLFQPGFAARFISGHQLGAQPGFE